MYSEIDEGYVMQFGEWIRQMFEDSSEDEESDYDMDEDEGFGEDVAVEEEEDVDGELLDHVIIIIDEEGEEEGADRMILEPDGHDRMTARQNELLEEIFDVEVDTDQDPDQVTARWTELWEQFFQQETMRWNGIEAEEEVEGGVEVGAEQEEGGGGGGAQQEGQEGVEGMQVVVGSLLEESVGVSGEQLVQSFETC